MFLVLSTAVVVNVLIGKKQLHFCVKSLFILKHFSIDFTDCGGPVVAIRLSCFSSLFFYKPGIAFF